MNDTQTNALVQTWVPAVDDRGRAYLEARWLDASQLPRHTTHAA
jgi:hypothetical protein